MNIFTTDAFLETAGALFYPKHERRIEVCQLEGRRLRLLVLDGTEVVTRMPFYDFPQPLEGKAGAEKEREISFFPRTVVYTTRIENRQPEGPGHQPSPYVDWKKHGTWDAFEAEWKTRAIAKSNDSPRQRRRLAKDLGELQFVLNDARPHVFERCLSWKSAQYKATGLQDMFADARNVALFHGLRERGVLVVSSLSAGDTLLAVHLGSSHQGRLGWWVPAYDAQWSKFSPGRLLLEDLLKASHERGDIEFDFLIGDEAYKFQYATHNRVIGPVGTPPMVDMLKAKAEKSVKALLEKNPRAMEWARSWKKRFTRA